MTNSNPSKLDFGDELNQPTRRTPSPSPSQSKRLPPKEIVYIPTATSPKDWTRKDKNAVAGAVAMGVLLGLITGVIILFMFSIAFAGLGDYIFLSDSF